MKITLSVLPISAVFFLSCAPAPPNAKPAPQDAQPASAAKEVAATPLPFERVFRTAQSGIAEAEHFLCATPDAWCAFWKRVHAGTDPAPPCPADVADFSRDVIVAVALGERRNGCHRVAVRSVGRILGEENALLVMADEEIDDGCPCTMAMVYPADAVRVRLPDGAPRPTRVVVEYDIVRVPCPRPLP